MTTRNGPTGQGTEQQLVSSLTASAASQNLEFGVALHPRPPWDRPDHRAAHPALYDSLTLLPTRALFLDRLAMALTRTHRTGEPLAVVLCEIDDYDGFVERHGPETFDGAISVAASRLAKCVRTADTVARGHTEQFLLLIERLAQPDDVTVVLERVLAAMREAIAVGDDEHHLTMSLGAVITNDPMLEFEELLDEAADLMDEAREIGPGRSQVSDWSFQIFGQAAAVLQSKHPS